MFKSLGQKLLNLIRFGVWTDCRHEQTRPLGMIDWECETCGACSGIPFGDN